MGIPLFDALCDSRGGSSALGGAMAKPRDNRQNDLLRPALEDIIDLAHPLVRLAREIDWQFLHSRFASVCTSGPRQPPLPTRLVAGLFILKHMHDLSDEVLCARWLENPYYQFFCGELSFCHQLPFDRSSMTHWRQRLGAAQLVALIQESLSVAHRTGAVRVRFQDHRQRGPKVYALHAPEVECIGKGKARAPYEFGCKVSIATPATKPKGGQFVLHAKALHGNPFDGHTLGPVITELEQQTGVETRRIHVDKGYRGHNHKEKFRVWISGQVRGVTKPIRREMRRRAAVEPVIGHTKAEHRMGRNYLKGRDGDRINAVLAAAGYNFGLLLRWLGGLLRALLQALFTALSDPQPA